MSVLDDVRFWAQVVGDAKRTIIVHTSWESDIRWLCEVEGWNHLTVKPSPFIPVNTFLVLDEQAIEAQMRQDLRRPIRYRPFARDE